MGHEALKQTGLRFILFDGGGLIAMLAIFLFLFRNRKLGLGGQGAKE
jgi:hypothetical protein